MAVSSLPSPNLAGSYANIQNALTEGANIASKLTGPAGTAAAGLAPIADEVQQRRQELFKYTLEDHLAQNKTAYAAQAEGKTLTTPDDAANFAKNLGLDPEKVKDVMPKGVYQTPQERMAITQQLKRQDDVEKLASQLDSKFPNQERGNILRLAGRSGDAQIDQTAMRLSGFSQLKTRINPATNTLEAYDPMNPTVSIPVDSPGSGSKDTSSIKLFDDVPSLRKVDGRQADALMAAQKESANASDLKSAAKNLDDLIAVRKLIKANIPGSQVNIGADTAKAVGNIPGAKFTNLISQKEGKDPSLWGKATQGIVTLTAGDYTKRNQDLLLQETDVASANKRNELATALQERHSQLKTQVPYASDDLIANTLGYQRYLQSSTPPPERQAYKTLEDLQAAVKSGAVNREAAIQIAKDRGWGK